VAPEQLMIVAPPQHLVASEARETSPARPGKPRHAGKGPSTSLVGGDIFVEFRIRNLLDYVRQDADSERRFRQIAELEVSRELFRFDVDTLISEGRMAASAVLRNRIQKAADRAGLGIEVMLVGFAGIHPPQEVADAFHETVAAEQERETVIQDAKQFAIMQLAQAAGTVEYAGRLTSGIERLEEQVATRAPAEAVARQEEAVERLLREAGGMVAEKIADARAYRWWKENSERGKAERFKKQLLTMRASPLVYRMSYYLRVLERGLEGARKYVLVGDPERLILRFDFKDVSGRLREASEFTIGRGRQR
jgi:regulator of protease activity HflC (stomatin/prohibitin superfamily)